MNTVEPTVTPGPLGWTPPYQPRRRRGRWAWLIVPLALLALAAVSALFVSLPYYEIAPGSARSVDDLVKVSGGPEYIPKGRVLLTTVSLGQVQNVYEAIGGWLNNDVQIVPERDILPPKTNQRQYEQQNLQDMTDSKDIAQYVAFRKLGYNVQVEGDGGLIVDVQSNFPASSSLHAGDVVVSADGKPIHLSEDLVKVIADKKAGDPITLGVRGDNGKAASHDVATTLGRRNDGSAMLGVRLQTFHQRFNFPFKVSIDSGEIGGPSAGLAFTLALLDVLTPGELTGGATIAATGTIAPDGSVGEVGGVAQKTVAVKRAGAKLFLVPSAEYPDAKAHAGKGLRVEKVDSLDDALRILASLPGSNALTIGSSRRA